MFYFAAASQDISPISGEPDLRHVVRVWLVRAQLAAAADTLTFSEPRVRVLVFLVSHQMWQGVLPSSLPVANLEEMWSSASQAVHLPAGNRVYSGPFQLPADATVGVLLDQAVRSHRVKGRGLPVLTFHPETKGGGAKVETKEWAQSQVATACLSQGMELKATSSFAEKLAAQCSTAKLTSALSQKSHSAQWEAVQELAKEARVDIPAISSANARTEARLKKAQASKKLSRPAEVKVEDVQIAGGFFKNADGTDARILKAMRPGASGVYLASPGHAAELLDTMAAGQGDELGVVVLGLPVAVGA